MLLQLQLQIIYVNVIHSCTKKNISQLIRQNHVLHTNITMFLIQRRDCKYNHNPIVKFPQQLEIVGTKLHYLELASRHLQSK